MRRGYGGDLMYKIGDFSKIVDVPVRTLRFYAECGVLIPSLTDEFTGYRYYDDSNVLECEKIKLLKSLDFTLEEIIRVKDNLTADVFESKRREITMKMCLLKDKCDMLSELQIGIENGLDFSRPEKGKVLIK